MENIKKKKMYEKCKSFQSELSKITKNKFVPFNQWYTGNETLCRKTEESKYLKNNKKNI